MSLLYEIYETRRDQWSDIQNHLPRLYDFGRCGGRIVELGTRSGNSTAAFLAGLIHAPSPSHLWSIDVVDVPGDPAWWRSGLWTFIKGDDLALRDYVPAEISVLFIDTLHHYDQTLAELRLYGPRSEIIVLHDTDLETPYGAPRNDPKFPVKAAIGTWLAENPDRSVEYFEGSYGLGVIT